jgi:hypothetical protein
MVVLIPEHAPNELDLASFHSNGELEHPTQPVHRERLGLRVVHLDPTQNWQSHQMLV